MARNATSFRSDMAPDADIHAQFHVPDNYFLSHSVGCLPKVAEAALRVNFLAPWQDGSNWTRWMAVLDGYRERMAELLTVEAATICPQTNVSSALVKLLHALPRDPECNVILLSRQDFPTIGFVLKQTERVGYSLRFVDDDPSDIASWRDAMDDRVALVHITHVLSNTSHMLPVQEICALAREAGAISIVDVAQSVGIADVKPGVWGADAVIGTGVKYLCCGPGACFLYVADALIPQCRPLDVGWFSHENPFEMDIDHFRYARDAMRFFGGTPSPAPFAMANAALDIWHDIGAQYVQESVQTRLDTLTAAVPESALVSPTERDKRGATLVINPPQARDRLRVLVETNGLLCDERKEGFRFSVHAYTPTQDVRTLAETLAEAL